jgi:hypothetical protein
MLAVGALVVTDANIGTIDDPNPAGPAPSGSESGDPVPSPTKVDPRPSFAVTDWLPENPTRGAPPKLGTLIYRTCADDGCVMQLVTPDGTEYPLADISPELAAKIEEHGLEGAALSHDGKQLGIRVNTGFEVFRIGHDSRPTYETPPGPEGSQWEVQSWGVGSSSLCLTQTQDETALAFMDVYNGRPYTYELDGGADLPPAPAGCTSLAHPIDTSVPPDERQRVTRPLERVEVVVVEDVAGSPQGTVENSGEDYWPVASELHDSETLAGPRGVQEYLWHPGTVVGDDLDRRGYKAFAPYGDELRVSAVVMLGYLDETPEYSRIDIPESTGEETWDYLGLTHDGVAVSRSSRSEDVTDVFVLPAGGGDARLLHTLPLDAEIVMPGAVVGDQ